MLTEQELMAVWIQIIFNLPKRVGSDPDMVKICYIAQDTSGIWYGYVDTPTRYTGGVWGNNCEGVNYRKFIPLPLHEGHDKHYYEVPAELGG